MRSAPDQKERDRAVAALDETVIIDAGAGTGKTTLLIERLLALVAPPTDDHRAIPLSRIAAVTFTRRAAGELRLRTRERVLKELAKSDLPDVRRRRLLDALGSIDGALLGTIHSFADRMLRLQPMKAKLSPAYDIVEDIDWLVDETFSLLLHAIQNGTLAAELEGERAEYVAEVERTFQEALRAGMLVKSYERDPLPPKVGLDLLIQGFIEYRDRDLTVNAAGAFDARSYRTAIDDFLAQMDRLNGESRGSRWLLRLGRRLEQLRDETDPVALYEIVGRIKAGKFLKPTKHFDKGDERTLWAEFQEKGGYKDRLTTPLEAVMARRLARTRRAVVRLYEKVKARHAVLDSIDLLMTLRDLLRDDLEARAFYQGLFDHLLVDELQDTDPLQTEILLYLAESKPRAGRWQDVAVGKGRLTLVGDPKQSIYRFRRADVGMYDQIRNQILEGGHVPVTLSANFRSVPPLIEWGNDRFAEILGTSKKGKHFDPDTGEVFHQRLLPGVSAGAVAAAVCALPYRFPDGEPAKAPAARELEGKAVADYLRWLIEKSGTKVRDADTDEWRDVRWGDVAVLALVTTNLRRLFNALDARGVPYAMSGGVLFTTDPLHQQFLLGLRALADRNDGVAEAALLRPPFFAVDLLDLVRAKTNAGDDAARRAERAREWVRDARRQRFERSPGQTGRALLEETGLGRAVALGPNGEQRLRHLHELCLQLELRAAAEGLDYDGVTARLRDWIDHPPQVDPPRPLGANAIQVMTVHQAKGLEFPVVVLWDGMGQWRAHEAMPPWRVDRNGTGWAMKTNDVAWEEPPEGAMLEREKKLADAEKRRLVYVAATRARDLLVVPRPAWEQDPAKYVHAQLLATMKPAWVVEPEPYTDGKGAKWSKGIAARKLDVARFGDDQRVDARWSSACDAARVGVHTPRPVTAIAKQNSSSVRVGDEEVPERARAARVGRFGPVFGETVHRAIGLVLKHGLEPRVAVERCAYAVGLVEHRGEAAADVERAITALRDAGLINPQSVVRVEYPVARAATSALIVGYVDFVSATAKETVIIDFKTDAWDARADYANYTAQVRAYADMVGARRSGLLFSCAGTILWTSK